VRSDNLCPPWEGLPTIRHEARSRFAGEIP
jgi:hypothetical protein